MEAVINAFLIILIEVPGIFFRYLPFSKDMNKAKNTWWTVIYCIAMAMQFAFYYFIEINIPDSQKIMAFAIVVIVSDLIYALINWIIVRGEVTKHLFVWGTVGIYMLILHAAASIVHLFITDIPVESQINLQCIAWVVIFLIFTPGIYPMLEKILILFFKYDDNEYWSRIWVLPVCMLVSSIVATVDGTWANTWQKLISRVLIGISAAVLFKCVAYSYEKSKKNATVAERLKATNKQLEMLKTYHEELTRHMDIIREAKHDLKFYKRGIQAYIRDNDREKLIQYFKDSKIDTVADKYIPFSGNGAVDSLVYYYWCLAKKENIKMSIDCKLPNKLNVSESDLCTLLGNCLSNAVEACRYLGDKSDKFINIKVDLDGQQIVIVEDNSFDGLLIKDNNQIMSRKSEGTKGIGIESMQGICDKYDGVCKFKAEGNVFTANFMLNN